MIHAPTLNKYNSLLNQPRIYKKYAHKNRERKFTESWRRTEERVEWLRRWAIRWTWNTTILVTVRRGMETGRVGSFKLNPLVTKTSIYWGLFGRVQNYEKIWVECSIKRNKKKVGIWDQLDTQKEVEKHSPNSQPSQLIHNLPPFHYNWWFY